MPDDQPRAARGYVHAAPSPMFADINYYRRPRQWSLGMHKHAYLQFLVVVSGTVRIATPEGQQRLTAGCASLIPPGVEHALSTETGYDQFGASLWLDQPGGLTALLRQHVKTAVVAGHASLAQHGDRMLHLLANGSALSLVQAELLVQQCLLDIVEHQLDQEAERFERQLPDYLTAHLADRLTAAQIAAHFHISVSHLERLAHRHFGMGVTALYNRKRASHACVLLRLSDLRIAEIAREVGFAEPSNFAAFFTKHTGQSPRQWQRQCRLRAGEAQGTRALLADGMANTATFPHKSQGGTNHVEHERTD